MKFKFNYTKIKFLIVVNFIILIFIQSCEEESKSLAPYVGSPELSNIVIEEGSFKPKITWLGGYVSILGINRGSNASLDSSLVFLIYKENDGLRFPVKFAEFPEGSQNLTEQYGGTNLDSLLEDSLYTFWILKEEAWQEVQAFNNKIFKESNNLDENVYEIENDTVNINTNLHSQLNRNLDIYTNIFNVTTRGRLANIFIEQSYTSNNPKIWWEIIQSGVTDTSISAIGLVNAGQYEEDKTIWETWSIDSTSGSLEYGTLNIISPPLNLGDLFSGTFVFTTYPENGLERNTTYFLWIANNGWDGANHSRFSSNHAYLTFQTW